MRVLKFILINFLVVIGLLVVVEAISRSVEPVDFPDPLVTTWRDDWQGSRLFDLLLFWRMRPNTSLDAGRSTNSLGLRGPEVLPKRPEEFRILSLGESTTFAPELSNEESYSSLLEAQLILPAKKLRVLNAGVPGYSLFQGYTYLSLHGLDLQPDAVMLYFGFNDFLPITFRSQRDALSARMPEALTDRQLFERRQKPTSRLGFWLLQHSNLARARVFGDEPATQAVVSTSDRPRVPEEDRWWLLSSIHQLSQDHGFRLVVVIPWYLEFDEHASLLREFSRGATDSTLVDLPARLEELEDSTQEYFRDQVHPNRRGHQLIADEIASVLQRSWGL